MQMRITNDRAKIVAMEKTAAANATDVAETCYGTYYFNKVTKSAMSFVRVTGGVRVLVSQNLSDCNYLIDELEAEEKEMAGQ